MGVLDKLRDTASPDALVGGDRVAILAAEKLIDRHAGGFAEDVPQSDVDAGHGAFVEPAAVATQPLRGVHLVPQNFDVEGVLAKQYGREQVGDGRLDDAGRHDGVGFSPAMEPLIGRDFDEQGLAVPALPDGLGVFEPVAEPGAVGHPADGRH